MTEETIISQGMDAPSSSVVSNLGELASWKNPAEAVIPSPCRWWDGKLISERRVSAWCQIQTQSGSPPLFGHALRKPLAKVLSH